jgi:hypothetical protein
MWQCALVSYSEHCQPIDLGSGRRSVRTGMVGYYFVPIARHGQDPSGTQTLILRAQCVAKEFIKKIILYQISL